MEDTTNDTESLISTTVPPLSENLTNDPCIIRRGDEGSEDFYHFMVCGICLNAVGILGLIGNIISITILSR